MTRGFERPPWWAVVVIVVGAVFLAVGMPIALGRESKEPLSRAEIERMNAAASAAAASDEAARPRVLAFLGDSYGEGTGADSAATGLASQVAQQMGWQLQNFSSGGTGYVNDASAEFPDRTNFRERVDRVIAARPDVVIVAGGHNDAEQDYSDQQVTDAVNDTLTGLRAGLPDVPILVIGPWWENGFPTQSASAVDRIVQQGADAAGMPFVSPIQQQWITGSNDGRTAGNREQYIGPDGVHPSQAGHDYLAGKIVEWLRTVADLPVAQPSGS